MGEVGGGSTRRGESTTTLKPYSLFITLNSFRLEHNILLNRCFVFSLKQLATESGCVKIWTFVARCQHFKNLHYIYIYIHVWWIRPALWSNFPSRHFAYIINLYNNRNIKHQGSGRKVLAVYRVYHNQTKIKPPHFSPSTCPEWALFTVYLILSCGRHRWCVAKRRVSVLRYAFTSGWLDPFISSMLH